MKTGSGKGRGRPVAQPRVARELTASQRRELSFLATLPDESIDLSDAPDVANWTSPVVGRFYRPIKEPVTLRIDADVLAWLKASGPGYQTRINRWLRTAMETEGARVKRSVANRSGRARR